jgi:hypothetical protein
MTTCTITQDQQSNPTAPANDQAVPGTRNVPHSLFYELFKGRTDTVGLATTLSTARHSEDAILEDVRNHLNGKCRLGFYNLLPNSTSPWAMIEFEDHGPGALTDPRAKSLEAVDHFRSNGVHCYRELSKNASGNSYHVWIFFTRPISTEKVQVSLNAFVKDTLDITTEVFPKGHNTESIGNFVWLPLYPSYDDWGLGIAEGRTVFIDDKGNPYPDQYDFLKFVERVGEDTFSHFIPSTNCQSKSRRNRGWKYWKKAKLIYPRCAPAHS